MAARFPRLVLLLTAVLLLAAAPARGNSIYPAFTLSDLQLDVGEGGEALINVLSSETVTPTNPGDSLDEALRGAYRVALNTPLGEANLNSYPPAKVDFWWGSLTVRFGGHYSSLMIWAQPLDEDENKSPIYFEGGFTMPCVVYIPGLPDSAVAFDLTVTLDGEDHLPQCENGRILFVAENAVNHLVDLTTGATDRDNLVISPEAAVGGPPVPPHQTLSIAWVVATYLVDATVVENGLGVHVTPHDNVLADINARNLMGSTKAQGRVVYVLTDGLFYRECGSTDDIKDLDGFTAYDRPAEYIGTPITEPTSTEINKDLTIIFKDVPDSPVAQPHTVYVWEDVRRSINLVPELKKNNALYDADLNQELTVISFQVIGENSAFGKVKFGGTSILEFAAEDNFFGTYLVSVTIADVHAASNIKDDEACPAGATLVEQLPVRDADVWICDAEFVTTTVTVIVQAVNDAPACFDAPQITTVEDSGKVYGLALPVSDLDARQSDQVTVCLSAEHGTVGVDGVPTFADFGYGICFSSTFADVEGLLSTSAWFEPENSFYGKGTANVFVNDNGSYGEPIHQNSAEWDEEEFGQLPQSPLSVECPLIIDIAPENDAPTVVIDEPFVLHEKPCESAECLSNCQPVVITGITIDDEDVLPNNLDFFVVTVASSSPTGHFAVNRAALPEGLRPSRPVLLTQGQFSTDVMSLAEANALFDAQYAAVTYTDTTPGGYTLTVTVNDGAGLDVHDAYNGVHPETKKKAMAVVCFSISFANLPYTLPEPVPYVVYPYHDRARNGTLAAAGHAGAQSRVSRDRLHDAKSAFPSRPSQRWMVRRKKRPAIGLGRLEDKAEAARDAADAAQREKEALGQDAARAALAVTAARARLEAEQAALSAAREKEKEATMRSKIAQRKRKSAEQAVQEKRDENVAHAARTRLRLAAPPTVRPGHFRLSPTSRRSVQTFFAANMTASLLGSPVFPRRRPRGLMSPMRRKSRPQRRSACVPRPGRPRPSRAPSRAPSRPRPSRPQRHSAPRACPGRSGPSNASAWPLRRATVGPLWMPRRLNHRSVHMNATRHARRTATPARSTRWRRRRRSTTRSSLCCATRPRRWPTRMLASLPCAKRPACSPFSRSSTPACWPTLPLSN